jgi:hypothetical protein
MVHWLHKLQQDHSVHQHLSMLLQTDSVLHVVQSLALEALLANCGTMSAMLYELCSVFSATSVYICALRVSRAARSACEDYNSDHAVKV